MKASLKRALVLGLGNRLAGDDSFGPSVIAELRDEPPAGADLAEAHTDLLHWIEEFPRYDLVVLVDALLAPELRAGSVVVLSEEQLVRYPETSPSVHQMSPVLALKLFRQLYPEALTRIVMVALQTAAIRFDVPLDQRAVDDGRTAVLALLGEKSGPSHPLT